jgi:hypothetical protein
MSDASTLWNAVLEKRASSGAESLSVHERVVYAVNSYLVDIENGGLSAVLYNRSPAGGGAWATLVETAVAIRAVGDEETAQILSQCASRLAAVINDYSTWGELMDVIFSPEEFSALDGATSERADTGWALLEAYTRRNFSEA